MYLGGGLVSDKTFKKILSIGYEFETHDITKLSLHKNKKSLINSNLTLRLLGEKMGTGSIKEFDDNYLSVRIPIGKTSKAPISEEVAEDDMTDEDREFMEAFKEEYEEDYEKEKMEKLQQHENDSYLEYFNEIRKTDNKKSVKFQITNDIGDGDFANMLREHCIGLSIPKNDMYFFKTKSGKILDFKFSEEISDSCTTFSGVEFVVTYYNPKKENPDVILDTFVDACSRIVDHVANLKKIEGTLMTTDDKKLAYSPIGVIEDSRCMYHKPGTNLFYMDTYDTENTIKLSKLGDVDFVPQMTFRSRAADTLEIMKEILRKDKNLKRGRQVINDQEDNYNDIVLVENVIDELIKKHNNSSEKKILLDTTIGKSLKLYIYLIFYKLYNYVQHHTEITYKESSKKEEKDALQDDDTDDNYLKDFLSFASRHTNVDLYKKIKEVLSLHYSITDINVIRDLLYQPDIIKPIYELKTKAEDYYDEFDEDEETDLEGIDSEAIKERDNNIAERNGKLFENLEKREELEKNLLSALTIDLDENDKHYGDPAKSLLSYLKYFEKPKSKSTSDWLIAARIDSYSTTYDIKEDYILLENRFFRYEIGLLLRNTLSKDLSKEGTMTIKEMLFVVNALYGKKKKNLINLEKNPYKNKLTKKCKPGYFRNINFQCVRQKTRKNTRAPGKTRTSLKNKLLKNKGKTEKLTEKNKSTLLTASAVVENKNSTPSVKINNKSTTSKNLVASIDNAQVKQEKGNFFQNIFGLKNEETGPASSQAMVPVPVQQPTTVQQPVAVQQPATAQQPLPVQGQQPVAVQQPVPVPVQVQQPATAQQPLPVQGQQTVPVQAQQPAQQ